MWIRSQLASDLRVCDTHAVKKVRYKWEIRTSVAKTLKEAPEIENKALKNVKIVGNPDIDVKIKI